MSPHYQYHPDLSLHDLKGIYKELCSRTNTYNEPSSTHKLIRCLDKCVSELASNLDEGDLADGLAQPVLRLFSNQINVLSATGMHYLIWKHLLPDKEHPLRGLDGQRLPSNFNQVLQRQNLAELKQTIKDHRLSVSPATGGAAKRKLIDITTDIMKELSQRAQQMPALAPSSDVAPLSHLGGGAYGRVVTEGTDRARKCARSVDRIPDILREITVIEAMLNNGTAHPNLCYYWECHKSTSTPSIVMERLHCTLLEFLNTREFELATTHPLTLLLDVARGLEFLHQYLNYFHGDLKESNIMLTTEFRAKLIDFDNTQHPLTPEDIARGSKYRNVASAVGSNSEESFPRDIRSFATVAKQVVRCGGNILSDPTKRDLKNLCDLCAQTPPTATELVEKLYLLVQNERLENPTYAIVSDYPPARTYNRHPPPPLEPHFQNLLINSVAFAKAQQQTRANTVRVASLNCRRLSMNKKTRLSALAELAVEFYIDIFALQETFIPSTLLTLQKLLSDQSGCEWSFVASSWAVGGEYCAFFFRVTENARIHSMEDTTLQIENSARPPLCWKFRCGCSRFILINVHLSPHSGKALAQFTKCVDLHDFLQRTAHPETNIYVLGDFNLDASATSAVEGNLQPHIPAHIPTNRPGTKQYDNIYSVKGLKGPLWVSNSSVTGPLASDHQMILFDLPFTPGELSEETTSLPVKFNSQ